MPAKQTRRPTLAEIRTWPPTVPVAQAATAYGISRASAYDAISRDRFPARTLSVGGRCHVVTRSILASLGEDMPPHQEAARPSGTAA